MKNSPAQKQRLWLTLMFAAIGGWTVAGPVFSFTGVSNNSATNTQIGESQFSVEVTDAAAAGVWFTFYNAGPDPSSITQVYFDNGPAGSGALSAITAFSYSNAGISFSVGAAPPNLPGGETLTPAFTATAGLTAAASEPAPHNGVNPFESVGILTTLAVPYSYADVLDQISTGALRIGIHAQAFADGGSESFVTSWIRPAPIVPTPGSLLLATFGLAAIRLVRYRLALA